MPKPYNAYVYHIDEKTAKKATKGQSRSTFVNAKTSAAVNNQFMNAAHKDLIEETHALVKQKTV